jgi:hypothetical protein
MAHVDDLSLAELNEIRGGDWFETTWGVLLGSGFAAGLVGSGGFLALGSVAGLALVFYHPF